MASERGEVSSNYALAPLADWQPHIKFLPVRSLPFRIGCSITALALSVSLLAAAGPGDDPRFTKFKREMLPKVGQKVRAVGKLEDGKEGFWLAFKNWGAYLHVARESGTTSQNDLYIRFRSGQTVTVTGTLRYRPDQHHSGTEHVQVAPEDFFIDVEKITIFRQSPTAAKHPK